MLYRDDIKRKEIIEELESRRKNIQKAESELYQMNKEWAQIAENAVFARHITKTEVAKMLDISLPLLNYRLRAWLSEA